MSFEETEEQLGHFSEFIHQGWELASEIILPDKPSSIVVCGMGGSGISGAILASYLELDIPIFQIKGYKLPGHIGKNALVFIVSYSGNTEETISAFRSAMGRGSHIVGVCSGGKLEKLCADNKLPCILLPKGLQPRAAIPLLFFPMLRVLHNSRLIEAQADYVNKTIETIEKSDYGNMGQALAEKLKEKIVLIYASEAFGAVAYRWKTQINENAKSMAFSNVIPELNHNELVSFEHILGDYYVIMLQDEQDSPRIKKRMKLTKELISSKGVSSTLIAISGTCKLSRLFSAIHMGDYVSLHLAGLYNIDPNPVHIIEDFKARLK